MKCLSIFLPLIFLSSISSADCVDPIIRIHQEWHCENAVATAKECISGTNDDVLIAEAALEYCRKSLALIGPTQKELDELIQAEKKCFQQDSAEHVKLAITICQAETTAGSVSRASERTGTEEFFRKIRGE